MAGWGSQSIQVVWFVQSLDRVRADHIYELVTGSEPDNVQRNKIPSPQNPFFGVATGTVGDREYQVQVQPARIDMIMMPAPLNSGSEQEFPILDTRAALADLLRLVGKAASELPESVRLSLITNLVKPEPNQETAVASVMEMTGLDLHIGEISDPILQLNRRKTLGEGVIINRVTRFSVGTFQQFMMQFDSAQGATVPISAQAFAAALSLDFNTVPDGRVFPGSQQITIFEELAREILRFADIRSPRALAD